MAYLTDEVLTQADIAALFTSGTYTPTLANLAIGTGGTPTNSAKWTFTGFPAGGDLLVEGTIKFGTSGTTLPGASAETISLPSGYSMIAAAGIFPMLGEVDYFDATAGLFYKGTIVSVTATTIGLYVPVVSGTVLVETALSATLPFAWAINDEIQYRYIARCTGP